MYSEADQKLLVPLSISISKAYGDARFNWASPFPFSAAMAGERTLRSQVSLGNPPGEASYRWLLHLGKPAISGESTLRSQLSLANPPWKASYLWGIHPEKPAIAGESTLESQLSLGNPP